MTCWSQAPAAVLSRLFRHGQTRPRRRRAAGRGHGCGMPGGGVRAAGRRDGRDARRVRAGRLRPGRLHRRAGRAPAQAPTATIQAGDVLVGLPSSGLHTNGYSLVRKVFEDVPLNGALSGARPDARRCAARAAPLVPRRRSGRIHWKGAAHITGGGILGNLPRCCPTASGGALERKPGRCRRSSSWFEAGPRRR